MSRLAAELDAITALAEAGELDEASRRCSELLGEEPEQPQVLAVMAWVYMQAERFGLAYVLLEKANRLWAGRSEILNNLGMCALGCLKLDDAEKHLRGALQADPQNAAAMNNLTLVYVNRCEPEKALYWARKSRAIVGDDPGLMESYGYANLMLGQWVEGWKGYEGGLEGKIRRSRQYQDEPYWDGQPVETLVIRGEQGIGDEISFASVIMEAKTRAKQVIIECDKRLEGLFRRSFDVPVHGTRFQAHTPWADAYRIDARVLSGSLCQYFRTEDGDFPGTPYLVADSERRLQWRSLLDSLGPRPKIGIAWNGGRHNTHRDRRSLKLAQWLPILQQDADFISLEYKDPSAEIAAFEREHGITIKHWPRAAEAVDYDETAALVAELDLVISVTTAAVDLCGALGKPCWVFVPEKPHWRYGMTGERKVWYDAIRLFRQHGDWKSTINQVGDELVEYLHRRGCETADRLYGAPILDHRPSLAAGGDHPALDRAIAG